MWPLWSRCSDSVSQCWSSNWRGAHQPHDPRITTLERRITALEQAQDQADTLTITFSLAATERIEAMRDLGGTVTPGQLFEELRRRGQAVNYTSILQWLHRSAKRGLIRKRYQGQYELKDNDDE